MRRNERERIARRNAYQASSVGYWTQRTLSLEDYFSTVKRHPSVPDMLDYLSTHPRDWTIEGEAFAFVESKDNVCEKCSVRALDADSSLELKSTTKSAVDGLEVHFSKFIADQLARGKEPITLTSTLHREFVYQSWVEAAHLDHIPRERLDEPGIAGIQGHPEWDNGVMNLALSLRALDGSHRAALTFREGKPFSVFVLTPVETLQCTFAIGNKKNPFFLREYTKAGEQLLAKMGSRSG